mmetsp:Transcript_21875/g.43013  ORF Transcript_21875/g.43013 Transcript_21875/m.43013 type:complete len:438 (-) Transcript_21875:218-1531(-)
MSILSNLHSTLLVHGLNNLLKGTKVGALDIINVVRSLMLAVFNTSLVDVTHDAVKLLINFLARPGKAHGVLRHLQGRDTDTTSVGSLGRTKDNLVRLEDLDSLRGRRHVGTLADALDTVLDKSLSVLLLNLVLGSTWKSHVTLYRPWALALKILHAVELVGVLRNATTLVKLKVLDKVKLLLVDTLLVVNGTRRIAEGDHLGAKLKKLLYKVDGNVARARCSHCKSLKGGLFGIVVVISETQHGIGEVHNTVSGGFRAKVAAAEELRLASKNTLETVVELLVHTIEVSNLATTDTNITGRDISVGANVAVQLSHKCLAESHHLVVALTLWVKVRATFASSDRETSETVLQDLLRTEELEDVEGDSRVETKTSFVGATCGVKLDTVATVHSSDTVVILPAHTKHDNALRFDKAGKDVGLVVFLSLITLQPVPHGVHDL